jgi:hypothetical protein
MELRVVGEGTTGLDNILIYSRRRHMHGVDVGFCKDRGGHGDDWRDEDLTSLAQLADVTSFSIPVNIADHAGPPKALTDVGFGCKGNLTNLRRILHLSLAKGNPK